MGSLLLSLVDPNALQKAFQTCDLNCGCRSDTVFVETMEAENGLDWEVPGLGSRGQIGKRNDHHKELFVTHVKVFLSRG